MKNVTETIKNSIVNIVNVIKEKLPKESLKKFGEASKNFGNDVIDATAAAGKTWFDTIISNKLERKKKDNTNVQEKPF